MEKRITVFTIFTFLLFTVSSAHIAESEVDKTTASERLPETQTFVVKPIDPTQRLIFSRPRPIQRHSFDTTTRIPLRFVRRHPRRKFKNTFMIPTKISYGNDMISSDKTVTIDLDTIGDQIPTKWLEFKHKYGHHHHHFHHDENEKFEIKYESNGEKIKKKEHKAGFMRRVRKFLKHTFD